MKTRHFTSVILFTFILVSPVRSLAQVTISGKVLDETKNPLPYASVSLKGTYDGASTNDKGEYSFKTSQKGKFTLVITYLGYEKQEIAVDIADKNLVIN